MNGIDQIIKKIEAESHAECEEILAGAQAKCAEIQAQYSALEQERYWAIANRGAKETAIRVERLGNVAQLEARKKLLAMKQWMLSAAFDRAVDLLTGLPEDEYTALLVRLIVRAVRSGDEEIILSAADLGRVGAAVLSGANAALSAAGRPGNLRLSGSPRRFRGGVILVNGKIETNCTFEALALHYKNELSGRVADAMFR